MEFKRIVFNAARDGELHRLQVSLDDKSKEEISMLVSAVTNESTPLVIACRNGHADIAVYLIDKCYADIEQVSSVTFDDETIEGASPLWAAAAGGNLNLVQILVKHRASVNSTTKSSSTPLRAACFDGHLDIVKYLILHGADIEIANKHGHTPLMIACHKGHYETAKHLLECGADVNRKSANGYSALHECAESGSLEILEMLLKHGAKVESDFRGTTPLLSAAMNCHASIVEYFIEKYNYAKLDVVNALKLLGAAIIDKRHDINSTHDFWKKAVQLCYEDEFPLEIPHTRSSIENYLGITEVHNFDQLEELISDPDKMRMQALLVRDRILGQSHPETIYYIIYRCLIYADNGNFDCCIKLWMYALDVQQKIQESPSPMTQNSLQAFAKLFSCMSESLSLNVDFRNASFQYILHAFQRALKEIEISVKQNQDLNDKGQFHRILNIAMHQIDLMCCVTPHLSKKEEMELKQAAYRLVHLNPKTKNGWTPLHLACIKDSPLSRYQKITVPSPAVVQLLLEVGACPNALDSNNNTPLHVAVMNKLCPRAIFRSLLNHGAHLDLCNDKRQTPFQSLQHTDLLDLYPLRYLSLQCLCAQLIQKEKIPYEGLVQKKLKEFVDSH